jgi:hypothetical protein
VPKIPVEGYHFLLEDPQPTVASAELQEFRHKIIGKPTRDV